MKRQVGFPILFMVLFLVVNEQPLASQDPIPPLRPTEMSNLVVVDPAPGETWHPFVMNNGATTPIQAHTAIDRPQALVGMTGYVQSEVLLLIYTNTASGKLDTRHVEMAKERARRTRDFIWRNSYFKYFINLTFLVIDDYVDASEYKSPFGCNWLWADDYDGDGESPAVDMMVRGVKEGQYDSINLFFPRNDSSIPLCGYGGLSWLGGWYWQDLGHTMLTANLLVPIGEALWNPFHHEYQHSIDGAFVLKGIDDYFKADYPWAEPLRFGDNWSFHAVSMRHLPSSRWFDLAGKWADYHEAPDADGDGVPDSGDLPLTEESLGSSSASVDSDGDGFFDLQEGMAGMFRASDPLAANSDGDDWDDAEDFAPLYPISDRIEQKMQILNGDPNGWTLFTDHLEIMQAGFSPEVYANWYAGTLFVMFKLDRPANIFIELDALGDGFWHGRDNYAFHLYPAGDPLRSVAVQDCSARQTDLERHCRYDSEGDYAFDRLVDPSDFGRFANFDGQDYIVQLAIPADEDTGFSAELNRKVGLSIWFEDVDGFWGRSAWVFEENDLVWINLLGADSAEMAGEVYDLGRCGEEKNPLAAKIEFLSSSGRIYETWSGEDGRYRLWLAESDNPYRMTPYRYGYQPKLYEDIRVEAGKLNHHEAGIQPGEPCITVEPLKTSLTLRVGAAGVKTLSIINDGGVGSRFSLENIQYVGDFHSWLTVVPSEGHVEAGNQEPVILKFDGAAAGAAPGVYSAALDLKSSDRVNPSITLSVTLDLVEYGLSVDPLESQVKGRAGASIRRRFTITNLGTIADTFDVAASSSWPVTVPALTLTLQPNEKADLWLEVQIPPGTAAGESESAVLTVSSQAAPDVLQEAALLVTVSKPVIYLPLVQRP